MEWRGGKLFFTDVLTLFILVFNAGLVKYYLMEADGKTPLLLWWEIYWKIGNRREKKTLQFSKPGACSWNVVVEWGYAERNKDVLELNAMLRKHKRNWNVNEAESTVRMQN